MPSICSPDPEPSWKFSFLIFFFFNCAEVSAKAINPCSVLWARLLRDALFLKAGLLLCSRNYPVYAPGRESALTHSAATQGGSGTLLDPEGGVMDKMGLDRAFVGLVISGKKEILDTWLQKLQPGVKYRNYTAN